MTIYKVYISNDTLQSLKTFLNHYKDDVIDYWAWRESRELNAKICDEIKESVKGFEMEFDEIIEYYNKNHIDDNYSIYEESLINQTNAKLKSLYSRYIDNKELSILLKILIDKKYK